MNTLQIVAIIITLTAFAGFANYHITKLPTAVGLLVISTLFSILAIAGNSLGLFNLSGLASLVSHIDFNEFVLHGILSVLLFAGALHIDIKKLSNYKYPIFSFATVGVAIATFATGYFVYYIAHLLQINLPLIYCLLFGALISPTDPVAVFGILNKETKDESLKAKITGEALFNDGTAVVIFLTILGIVIAPHGQSDLNYGHVAYILLKEIIGGILLGLSTAFIIMWIIKTIDSYQIEILLTLSLALGSYALAEGLHVSAPIAAVVAGLFMGNQGMKMAMNEKTREHVNTFWEFLDEIMNSVLFVMIGLMMILIKFNLDMITLGLGAIAAVLVARYISLVGAGLFLLKTGFNIKRTPVLMTWAGLRGGISIALALSLPESEYKNILLSITYIVVVFSVIVQGLTLGKFLKIFQCSKL